MSVGDDGDAIVVDVPLDSLYVQDILIVVGAAGRYFTLCLYNPSVGRCHLPCEVRPFLIIEVVVWSWLEDNFGV